MLIYEFLSSSVRCRANPNLFRRSFEPFDQMLYHLMVLEPHTAYLIPAGTHYILLTVQKAVFAHVHAETNRRPLEEQPVSSSKRFPNRSRVFITPIIRPSLAPVWTARLSTTLASPLPVIIPDLQPPVQIIDLPVQILHPSVQIPVPPVQLFLPDPPQPPVQIILPDPPVQLPPVVDTLEPNLKHDSSIDHIMLSIFGDITQQGIQAPPAHTQELQVLDTVPLLFDESNDLISFFDHFQTGLAGEQHETSMDLTMSRLKKKVRKTTGF
ncbi:hypothetical protein TNCV_339861 [Trichonephila clavipes]|nr:hypothetical protein TNCV_339861 [Trichonephila clavipes]